MFFTVRKIHTAVGKGLVGGVSEWVGTDLKDECVSLHILPYTNSHKAW